MATIDKGQHVDQHTSQHESAHADASHHTNAGQHAPLNDLPCDAKLELFRITALRPPVMHHEDVEISEALTLLLKEGYIIRDCFGPVSMLHPSMKGLHFCSEHCDEMDKDTLGFLPLF